MDDFHEYLSSPVPVWASACSTKTDLKAVGKEARVPTGIPSSPHHPERVLIKLRPGAPAGGGGCPRVEILAREVNYLLEKSMWFIC